MYKRWYDQYSELKSLLVLLEKIDDYSIEMIAQDFIQILTSRYKNDFDSKIQTLCENSPKEYKRWYDENYNLHTCIEFIKTLSDDEKKEIISAFIISLMSFIDNVDEK